METFNAPFAFLCNFSRYSKLYRIGERTGFNQSAIVYYITLEIHGNRRIRICRKLIGTEGEARFASLWNLNIFEEWIRSPMIFMQRAYRFPLRNTGFETRKRVYLENGRYLIREWYESSSLALSPLSLFLSLSRSSQTRAFRTVSRLEYLLIAKRWEKYPYYPGRS